MRAVFEDGFASGAEVGASVCVTVDGETVVDLWGGFADADRFAFRGSDSVGYGDGWPGF